MENKKEYVDDSVGGVWVKKTKKGENFLSMQIELEKGKKINLVAWKNKRKVSPNHPDFILKPQKEFTKKEETKKEEPKEEIDQDLLDL